jgi:putative spermidine/putrescine transport system substrate-binding protein
LVGRSAAAPQPVVACGPEMRIVPGPEKIAGATTEGGLVRRPRTRLLAGVLARAAALIVALTAALPAALTGCAAGAAAPAPAPDLDPADWPGVLNAARGRTLDWYLHRGDDAINAVVDGFVTNRLAENGITLNVVPVADTADAVAKVLAERQAGRTTDGTVDAIRIDDENVGTGGQAGLWYCGYPAVLPNARHVDLVGFGVPVDGCEAAWHRANSVLVYDSAQLGESDVASLVSLTDWARSHPGRFTYPAPSDPTGSMVVRTFLHGTAGDPSVLAGPFDEKQYAQVADRLWPRLNALEQSLWRGGASYPVNQDFVERLYATGEIAAFFAYGPGTVGNRVADGTYPPTTRTAVPSIGSISDVSSIAIPANSPDVAAALVLANLLQDPETQLRFYADAGVYPVIGLDRTDAEVRQEFATVPLRPAVLPVEEFSARMLPDLDQRYVTAVQDDWTAQVQER